MQKWLVSVAVLALALTIVGEAQRGGGRGGAPGGGRGAPARPVAGNGVEVPGWWARMDNPKEGLTGLKFAPASGGMHAGRARR